MAKRTVLLDATEAVIGAHQELIANGTVAQRRSRAPAPPSHRRHLPDVFTDCRSSS